MQNSEVDVIHVETIRSLQDEYQLRFVGKFIRQFIRGHDPRQLKLWDKIKKQSKNKYSTVVLDSTFLGTMVSPIRKLYPESKIVVIAHNNEYRYHKIAVKQGALIKSLFIPIACKAERLVARDADICFCFSDRNEKYFKSLGARKTVNLRYPISESKVLNQERRLLRKNRPDRLMGYIGSDNIFNRRAAETVASYVHLLPNTQLIVAGSVKLNLNQRKNVIHSGVVSDLPQFYDSVDVIVNPAHLGEGIKIKTFEALEYRVPVIGFKEAFEGVQVEEFGGFCKIIDSLGQIDSCLRDIKAGDFTNDYKLIQHRQTKLWDLMGGQLF